MPRLFPLILFLLFLAGAARAAAEPVTLQLASALEWPGELALRGDLTWQDLRLAAACRALRGPSLFEQAGPDRILAGLSLPWLKVGPLSPAGVIREASNPAGFGAGSDVFVQRSGLLLDLSFPGRPPGMLFMPIPRIFGVFCESAGNGGQRAGCLASFFSREGASVEGFFSISDLPAEDPGEEWLRSSAPFPGGRFLTGAARLLVGSPFFDLALSLGASAGERFAPGRFSHLHFAARAPGVSACVLFARVDGTYVTPAGEHCPDAGRLSLALVLSGSPGSADFRFSRFVRQLPFSPGACREHRDEAVVSLERTLASDKAFSISARVEGVRIVHGDVNGGREGESRGTAGVIARVPGLRLEASVTGRDPPGLSARVSTEAVFDRRGSSAGLSGCMENGGGALPSFSTNAFFRLRRKDFSLTLEAALEKACLEGARFSVLWSVREVREWEAPLP